MIYFRSERASTRISCEREFITLLMPLHRSKQRGEADFVRYENLFRAGEVPFVRASGSQRVIDSSANWTSGKTVVCLIG